MEHDRTRRRILQVTGTGTALSLAGCLDSLGGDGDGNGDDGDEAPNVGNGTSNGSQDDGNESDSGGDDETDSEDDGGDASNALLTAVVEPDQEEMQSLGEDINQRVQDGNLSQQEAQQEYQQRQQELTQEAAEAFESSAGGIDGVTIEDSVMEAGAFLLGGDPTAVIDLLNDDDESVSALLPEATFQQVQQQQGQGQGTQP